MYWSVYVVFGVVQKQLVLYIFCNSARRQVYALKAPSFQTITGNSIVIGFSRMSFPHRSASKPSDQRAGKHPGLFDMEPSRALFTTRLHSVTTARHQTDSQRIEPCPPRYRRGRWPLGYRGPISYSGKTKSIYDYITNINHSFLVILKNTTKTNLGLWGLMIRKSFTFQALVQETEFCQSIPTKMEFYRNTTIFQDY